VGSESILQSDGGYMMRSLAVWKRSLSFQEVKNVYLAGKKCHSYDVMVLCIEVIRSYSMIFT